LLVAIPLDRPGVRLGLADFPASAITAGYSQHCLDGFKIKKGRFTLSTAVLFDIPNALAEPEAKKSKVQSPKSKV
jgi:hypothetical protein